MEESKRITWNEIENKILKNQSELLTKELLGNFPYENTGNELRIPPWYNIFQLNNLIPLIAFFLVFRFISAKVKKHLWKDSVGFRQYRLQNLTVSLIHSIISGILAIHFAYFYTEAMFQQPMHWYQPWIKYGILFSMGYFFHDMRNTLQYKNEFSWFNIALVLHHIGSIFAFVTAITSRKFVPFAYCALIMEANSIFLHGRTLMQLSNTSTNYYTIYKFIQIINVITFVGCRFGIQTWQMYWVFTHRFSMHPFFVAFGYCGCIIFFVINGFIFKKILIADFMPANYSRKNAAVYRDERKD
uniref:TLC domain-containing protein n=1 Tax=Panagrolaimus sp. PS1159 TaxID=55785 RepID=A0AC35G301_9BILA